ncbi:hypothetical protein D9M68_342180 [compost metagenome]
MAGTVGSSTGALNRRAFAVVLHVAAEGPLVDLAFGIARERHAVVLELIDRLRRFHGEILHGVDVAEPIGTLDGVVEVPLPAVRRHVLQRGSDAALGGNRVRAGREDLGDAGGLQTLLCHAEGGTQTGAAGADDDDVEGVIDIFIGLAVCSG